MKPALTREEWEDCTTGYWFRECDSVYARKGLYQISPHGEAALRLFFEPFGFTREDVRLLREEASWHNHSMEYFTDPRQGKLLDDLADRIEALLPPEEVIE